MTMRSPELIHVACVRHNLVDAKDCSCIFLRYMLNLALESDHNVKKLLFSVLNYSLIYLLFKLYYELIF